MQTESEQLFEESKKYIPGGVNSPVRAFGSVGRSPIFIKKAKGSRIFDEDGREYIDYVCSWRSRHSNTISCSKNDFRKICKRQM